MGKRTTGEIIFRLVVKKPAQIARFLKTGMFPQQGFAITVFVRDSNRTTNTVLEVLRSFSLQQPRVEIGDTSLVVQVTRTGIIGFRKYHVMVCPPTGLDNDAVITCTQFVLGYVQKVIPPKLADTFIAGRPAVSQWKLPADAIFETSLVLVVSGSEQIVPSNIRKDDLLEKLKGAQSFDLKGRILPHDINQRILCIRSQAKFVRPGLELSIQLY